MEFFGGAFAIPSPMKRARWHKERMVGRSCMLLTELVVDSN
jgi:hypothetical protein